MNVKAGKEIYVIGGKNKKNLEFFSYCVDGVILFGKYTSIWSFHIGYSY